MSSKADAGDGAPAKDAAGEIVLTFADATAGKPVPTYAAGDVTFLAFELRASAPLLPPSIEETVARYHVAQPGAFALRSEQSDAEPHGLR